MTRLMHLESHWFRISGRFIHSMKQSKSSTEDLQQYISRIRPVACVACDRYLITSNNYNDINYILVVTQLLCNGVYKLPSIARHHVNLT